eukprot:sb/3471711/
MVYFAFHIAGVAVATCKVFDVSVPIDGYIANGLEVLSPAIQPIVYFLRMRGFWKFWGDKAGNAARQRLSVLSQYTATTSSPRHGSVNKQWRKISGASSTFVSSAMSTPHKISSSTCSTMLSNPRRISSGTNPRKISSSAMLSFSAPSVGRLSPRTISISPGGLSGVDQPAIICVANENL